MIPDLLGLGGRSGPNKQVRRRISLLLLEGGAPPEDQSLARVVSPWTFTSRGQSSHGQGALGISVARLPGGEGRPGQLAEWKTFICVSSWFQGTAVTSARQP